MIDEPVLKLDWCSTPDARYAVEHWHYSKTMPSGKLITIGVWENNFVGCVIFSRGANPQIGIPYNLTTVEVCELTRVALRGHNSPVSRILSIAIKLLKKQSPGIRLIVSYADAETQQHHGGIYQAANWVYVGRANAGGGGKIILNDKIIHSRTVHAQYGRRDFDWLRANVDQSVRRAESATGKHKYLFVLDESLRPKIVALAQSYPKRERSKENVAAPPSAEGGVIPTRSLQDTFWSDEELEANGVLVFFPVDISQQPRLDQLEPRDPIDKNPPLFEIEQLPAAPTYRLQSSSVLDFLRTVKGEALHQEPGATVDASRLKIDLESRGHRLLTRDDKFFVSAASRLTAEDRAALKEHRAALIQLAEEWKDERTAADPRDDGTPRQSVSEDANNAGRRISEGPEADRRGDDSFGDVRRGASDEVGSLFTEPRPSQTLAQFLGNAAPDRAWTPDEPPSLDGIDEVILNFATTGLDWAGGHRPVGVTVSTLDGQLTRFLPFAFAGGNLDEITVKRWAERELRGKKIANAKTKFDVHHARVWGIDLEAQGCTFSDIQHTAALLDDHRKRFALDVLDADYFPDQPKVPRVDESRHADYHAAAVAERELYTARLVGRLRDAMYPEIDKQELRQVQDLEDAVIPCVVEMERNGSPIDVALLERYGRECNAVHDALMMEISQEAGFAFEHTATGWKRLIEALNLPVPDSFAESVLNEVDHPLVRKGQRAAQYASLNSKIFKAYPDHIRDGILRYGINQLASDEGGTVSGRFSIGLVQQVPNADNHAAAFGNALFPRRLFVPGTGTYLEADAAQIEFRLLVHYSGNAKLLQAYKDDPRMSFHKQMWAMLKAHKPDMLYTHVKSYNFAAQYGARSIKLAVMMGFITEQEGDEIRAAKRWNDPRLDLIHQIEGAYKQAHPEAGALLDRAAHLAKPACDKSCRQGDLLHRQFQHRGYVKTLLGRRSRFPTSYKAYIGLNRVLQGTGADAMKQKLVELHAVRRETGFVMRITNHDAVLGDALEPDTLTKVSEVLNRQSFELKVPILWECGQGPTWADCKS